MILLIDGKERKRLIADAKKYGGITIPRMKLQVHQSGAKFPISKVYVDDEQLNPDTFYILVIIPEGTSVSGFVRAVILVLLIMGSRSPRLFRSTKQPVFIITRRTRSKISILKVSIIKH